jgi:hypothetical protein
MAQKYSATNRAIFYNIVKASEKNSMKNGSQAKLSTKLLLNAICLSPYGLNNESRSQCRAGHRSPDTILSEKCQKNVNISKINGIFANFCQYGNWGKMCLAPAGMRKFENNG